MAATFRANQAGIRAIAATEGMARAIRQPGELVAERARELAPVLTGQYKAGIHVDVIDRDGKKVARVSTDPVSPEGYHYGASVEFGTENMEGQRVFGRALDVLRGP